MLYHMVSIPSRWSTACSTSCVTSRSAPAAATLTALFISFVVGPWLIRRLDAAAREDSRFARSAPITRSKAGTPTMGGLLILTSLVVSVLLWSRARRIVSPGSCWDVTARLRHPGLHRRLPEGHAGAAAPGSRPGQKLFWQVAILALRSRRSRSTPSPAFDQRALPFPSSRTSRRTWASSTFRSPPSSSSPRATA